MILVGYEDTGKTSIVVTFAYILAEMGKKIQLFIDPRESTVHYDRLRIREGSREIEVILASGGGADPTISKNRLELINKELESPYSTIGIVVDDRLIASLKEGKYPEGFLQILSEIEQASKTHSNKKPLIILIVNKMDRVMRTVSREEFGGIISGILNEIRRRLGVSTVELSLTLSLRGGLILKEILRNEDLRKKAYREGLNGEEILEIWKKAGRKNGETVEKLKRFEDNIADIFKTIT